MERDIYSALLEALGNTPSPPKSTRPPKNLKLEVEALLDSVAEDIYHSQTGLPLHQDIQSPAQALTSPLKNALSATESLLPQDATTGGEANELFPREFGDMPPVRLPLQPLLNANKNAVATNPRITQPVLERALPPEVTTAGDTSDLYNMAWMKLPYVKFLPRVKLPTNQPESAAANCNPTAFNTPVTLPLRLAPQRSKAAAPVVDVFPTSSSDQDLPLHVNAAGSSSIPKKRPAEESSENPTAKKKRPSTGGTAGQSNKSRRRRGRKRPDTRGRKCPGQ